MNSMKRRGCHLSPPGWRFTFSRSLSLSHRIPAALQRGFSSILDMNECIQNTAISYQFFIWLLELQYLGKNLLIVFDRFRLNELRKLQKLKSSDNMFRTFQTSSDLWRTHYGRLRGWSWAQCILSLGMTPSNPDWEFYILSAFSPSKIFSLFPPLNLYDHWRSCLIKSDCSRSLQRPAREDAAGGPAGLLQQAGETRGQRVRGCGSHIRLDPAADHRRGMFSWSPQNMSH